MLILFDIDMTLVETDHIGIDLLRDAGRSLFDPSFCIDGISFGGCLDPVIIAQMLVQNRVEPTQKNIRSMRTRYHQGLKSEAAKSPIARPLPGALELVEACRSHPDIGAIGLLTGNYQETGTIKLQSAGFDTDVFLVNAWGDDSPHPEPLRSHLPPVAIENFRTSNSNTIEPEQVVIIGDTVHDVRCAIENSCRVLAVATGHASAHELRDAGADMVVEDLSDTVGILEWMTPI